MALDLPLVPTAVFTEHNFVEKGVSLLTVVSNELVSERSTYRALDRLKIETLSFN